MSHKVYIGKSETQDEKPDQIDVTLGGETQTVPYKEGTSLLDSLLKSDINAPYSCMEGACMACMAKLTEGQIYQDDPGILTDENIENQDILTCQAIPVTKVVKINYDEV